MKMLMRILTALAVAVGSIVLVQRVVHRLYAGMGKKYIRIEERIET